MEKRTRAAEPSAVALTGQDLELLKAFYDKRFKELGEDVRTVGWGSRADQHLRFEVICRDLDLRGKRILDIGCGLGDFIPWAEQKFGPDFDYVGVDLSKGMISAASQRFNNPRRQFFDGAFALENPSGEFDISILSGTLTFKTSDNNLVMRRVLSTAWEKSREAICANFMTSYADRCLEKNHHFSPEEVFAFAKSLSRFVVLYHDYDLWEFTVQILRGPKLKEKNKK